MKRGHIFSFLTVLVATVILFSGTVFAASYKARISVNNTMTHPNTIGVKIFKQYVEDRTKGDVEVRIYANSQLGGERESVEQVKNGSLEMATTSGGPLSTFNPKFMVMDIPFAFDSYDIAWATLDGMAGQNLLKSNEEVGLKGLAFFENGFRHVTNNVRPIKNVGDFDGVKIRTMEAPMHMENFKKLGANPTPIPWPEVYMAMQQKVVDGQENPLANIWEVNMFEVQKYVSLTGHVYDSHVLVANLDWFNGLSEEYRAIVAKGAILGQNYSRFINEAREKGLAAKLTEKGMMINDVSDAAKAKMRAKSQAAVVKEMKAVVDPKFVDEWRNAIEAVKKDVFAGM